MAEGSRLIRLAVFGQPVAQSLSPRIHGLFGKQLGLAVEYRAIEASPEAFPSAVRAFAAAGARGCNVTVPLKELASELAELRSPRADLAQAVNTLVFEPQGPWFGDNTDGQGLVDDLREGAGLDVRDLRIFLLGAGGAAAGILGALLEGKPGFVVVANRTPDRSQALVARHRSLGRVLACGLDDIGEHAPFDLVLNATSSGHGGAAPDLDAHWFAGDALCYDLNYGPAGEPLRHRCAALGIRYRDGLGMLVGQAALSFERWTGRRPCRAPVVDQLRSEAARGLSSAPVAGGR